MATNGAAVAMRIGRPVSPGGLGRRQRGRDRRHVFHRGWGAGWLIHRYFARTVGTERSRGDC